MKQPLNDGYGHKVARDTTAIRRDHKYQPSANYGGECLGVYYHRLLRDGWRLVDRPNVGNWKGKDIFEKSIGKGWTLGKIAHAEIGAPVGKGCYWDEHQLMGPSENQTIYCPTWEWADLDGKRLVWTACGKLYAANVQKNGLAEEAELHDFTDMTFEAIEAPY